jgi:hypothetical protein
LLRGTNGWNYGQPANRLLVTGHIAEWLLYLPEDLQPPAETYRRAVQWLYQELKRSSPSQQWEAICPFSHAACVVRQVMFESTEMKEGK